MPVAAARERFIVAGMDHRIIHACGHAQLHHIPGFASQQNRKADWLRTTPCRTCSLEARRAETIRAAATGVAAIAHLDLCDLVGSERQVAWAATIRARRLAALAAERPAAIDPLRSIAEARWWIDHRDVADADLPLPLPCAARAA